MSTNQPRFNFSKKSSREMTTFLGHELLYDYISDELDDDRKKAVEEFLNQNKEAQQDLIKILNGLKYAEQLADTVVSQSILEKIQEPETYLSVLLKKSKFDQWPMSIKWSIEALIVVMGIVVLLVLIPWDKALRIDITPAQHEIILAEVKKNNNSQGALSEADSSDKPDFVDESPTATTATAQTLAVNQAAQKKIEASKPQAVPDKKNIEKEVPEHGSPLQLVKNFSFFDSNNITDNHGLRRQPFAPTETKNHSTTAQGQGTQDLPAAQPTKESKPQSVISAAAPVAVTETAKPDEKIAKANSGSLFRGILKVTNAEAVSPKITEKILALGGRKAGEVDLGWKKSENNFYYHFTIPEAKYEELKQFLAEYSKLDLKKENHPRVMPDGIIRLILQVEEK